MDKVAHGTIGIAAIPRTDERTLARNPALRGVDAIKGIMVKYAGFCQRYNGKRRIFFSALQVVVASRQTRQNRRAVLSPDCRLAYCTSTPVGERV